MKKKTYDNKTKTQRSRSIATKKINISNLVSAISIKNSLVLYLNFFLRVCAKDEIILFGSADDATTREVSAD